MFSSRRTLHFWYFLQWYWGCSFFIGICWIEISRSSNSGNEWIYYEWCKAVCGRGSTKRWKMYFPNVSSLPSTKIVPISTPRLYIGKIPGTVKKHDIVQVFSVFGDIVQLNMKEEYAFIVIWPSCSLWTIFSHRNMRTFKMPTKPTKKWMVQVFFTTVTRYFSLGNKLGGSRIIVQEAKPKYGDFGSRGSIQPLFFVWSIIYILRRVTS